MFWSSPDGVDLQRWRVHLTVSGDSDLSVRSSGVLVDIPSALLSSHSSSTQVAAGSRTIELVRLLWQEMFAAQQEAV